MNLSRTEATIAELEKAEWFRSVGLSIDGPVVVVHTWEEAAKACKSRVWEDLQLEASNSLAESVKRCNPDAFKQWNSVAKRARGIARPLVQRKLDKIKLAEHLREGIETCVRWDVIHLVFEAEYSDVVPPGFFASQAYWYVEGRFPCGWDGDFPNGRQVIF